MDHVVQVDEELGIVMVTAKGEWEREADDAMVRRILETVASTHLRKVVLDIRELHFDLPVARIFERTKEMREHRQEFSEVSTKTALIYSDSNPKLVEDMQFFETVSRNRGLPYRVFTDIKVAMKWIVKNEQV